MDKTYIDNIVELPAKIIRCIGSDKDVVSLLTNNPQIDMDSDEADDVFDKFIYDYNYVDDSSKEVAAYICVETEMSRDISSRIQSYKVYVMVYCHKEFMSIDPSKFEGLIGCRRDNIVRAIDKVLHGTEKESFGIGEIELRDVRTINAPSGFCARELTYWIPDFREKQ